MVGQITEDFSKLPASQMLDLLINQAIDNNASYIHIEPGDAEVLVRYRINGSLVEIDRFSKTRFDSFLERLKTLANLEIKMRNIPQDGKFKVTNNDSTYTINVSIIPTIGGEKISISLLNSSMVAPDLSALGYWGHSLSSIQNALLKSKGLILLVGPRDSGKSLSLLSMLSNIKEPDRKIATIEDPVEYVLKGANQLQVNTKTNLTFSSALKLLEKHDNDIIMVSEIRDSQTAELVFQNASHGKLILSSIYANHISSAIDKLNAAGIDRALIAHSLNLISSQRLVRRLCSYCRESFEPSKDNLSLINNLFDLKNPSRIKLIHKIEEDYTREVILNGNSPAAKDLATTEGRVKRLWQAHDGGCEKCLHTGYKGRLGVYEVFEITPATQKLITSLASPKVLLAKASSEGSVSLLDDGLVKALQGQTSINEIIRLQQDHFQ